MEVIPKKTSRTKEQEVDDIHVEGSDDVIENKYITDQLDPLDQDDDSDLEDFQEDVKISNFLHKELRKEIEGIHLCYF